MLGAEAEWQRLEPVLVALQRNHPDAILSVDTFHAEVARRALAEGADIINDVSGGDADPDMWNVVAQARAPYVLMHMQGTPATMQDNPTYDDVVHDVVTHCNVGSMQLTKPVWPTSLPTWALASGKR